MIAPELERARPPAGPGSTDAVTFAFAEPARGAAGFVRIGLAAAEDGGRTASVLGVLFDGDEPVAAVARGTVGVAPGVDWASLEVPGARTTILAPLERWTAAFADDSGSGFALEFVAAGTPAEQDPAHPASRLGGMVGYEQLCRVRGTVRVRGRDREIRCPGQRGHAWGAPDWERMEAARTVTAWFDDGNGVTLTAVRPAGARGHDADAIWGALLGAEPRAVDDPRLSTTWDEDGHQRRAGLELWVRDGDDHAHRAAGGVRCGSTLDLGRLRLDCAFFTWVSEGRRGVGRYDVLRRA